MRSHQVRSYVRVVKSRDRTPDLCSASSVGGCDGAGFYEIRVEGRLGQRWSSAFDGLEVVATDDGTTVIRGPVVDQSALHGLLHRLRDIGVDLVSLARVEDQSPELRSSEQQPSELQSSEQQSSNPTGEPS